MKLILHRCGPRTYTLRRTDVVVYVFGAASPLSAWAWAVWGRCICDAGVEASFARARQKAIDVFNRNEAECGR